MMEGGEEGGRKVEGRRKEEERGERGVAEDTGDGAAGRSADVGKNQEAKGAAPGIEPGTSRTLSENHATRPSSR